MRWLFSCILIASFFPLLAQKQLKYQEIEDFTYMARLSSDGDSLIRTFNPRLDPWLPHQQFGWLITDEKKFDFFFQHLENRDIELDFDRYFILALIRYDAYSWRMEIEDIQFAPKTPNIEVSYQLSPAGKRRANPVVSTLLVQVEKNNSINRLGIENIPFSLQEKILSPDPDIPAFGEDENELIFPLAYTLEELLPEQKKPAISQSRTPARILEPTGYYVHPMADLWGTNFLTIRSLEQWEAVFHAYNPKPLPVDLDFETMQAVVVIKRTEGLEKIEKESLTHTKEGIQIRYHMVDSDQSLLQPFTSYVILLEKKHNIQVNFLENGQQMKAISLKSP